MLIRSPALLAASLLCAPAMAQPLAISGYPALLLERQELAEKAAVLNQCKTALAHQERFLRKVAAKNLQTEMLRPTLDALMDDTGGCYDRAFAIKLLEALTNRDSALEAQDAGDIASLYELYAENRDKNTDLIVARMDSLRKRYWIVAGTDLWKAPKLSRDEQRQLAAIPENWKFIASRYRESRPHRAIFTEMLLDPDSGHFSPTSGIDLLIEAGSDHARVLAAKLLLEGKLVEANPERALDLLRMAAVSNDDDVAGKARYTLKLPLLEELANGPSIPREGSWSIKSGANPLATRDDVAHLLSEVAKTGGFLELNEAPKLFAYQMRSKFILDDDYPASSIRAQEGGVFHSFAIFGPDGHFVAAESHGAIRNLRDETVRLIARRAFPARLVLATHPGRYVRFPLPLVDYWLVSRAAAAKAGIVLDDRITVFTELNPQNILYSPVSITAVQSR